MTTLRARGFSFCCFLVTTLVSLSLAQVAPEVKDTADKLAGSVYTGPSMETLRELADGFGGRLSGSPAYNRAADWAAAKFKSYGIQNVKMEPFTMPNGWQRGSAHATLLAPMNRPLHLESLGWAPSTRGGGVTGEVVLLDDISADNVKAKADKLKGKIVLVDARKALVGGWMKNWTTLESLPQRLRDAGAHALILSDHENDNVLNAFSLDWGGHLGALPEAQLGKEDSELLERLLEKGPVSMEFGVTNSTSGSMQVNDIVAEIKGDTDEWILIGGHFDSWDYGTGAQDNGTGAVSVLEVARAIAALGKPPKRTIRFALWGGEEEGLLGSYAYAQAHLSEMAKCVAVLNTDNGAGHPQGWKVEGRKDLKDAMQPISDAVLKDIGGGGLSMEVSYDTDHGPFLLQGVPALDLWVDMSHYFEIHHKSSDTYDKVDPIDFKAGEAIVAATAWVIAQDPKPIAGHIDHAAVAEILKKNGLDELLTSVGQWKP